VFQIEHVIAINLIAKTFSAIKTVPTSERFVGLTEAII